MDPFPDYTSKVLHIFRRRTALPQEDDDASLAPDVAVRRRALRTFVLRGAPHEVASDVCLAAFRA